MVGGGSPLLDIFNKKVYNSIVDSVGFRRCFMTEYLTNYMNTVTEKLAKCSDKDELEDILAEHMDKIAFMQHERIVHFLVTFMFAVILCIFVAVMLFMSGSGNLASIGVMALVVIILVLEGFYIKHYYFLENTVQKMYRIYDEMLAKRRAMAGESK